MKSIISYGPLCFLADDPATFSVNRTKAAAAQASTFHQLFRRPAPELSNYSPERSYTSHINTRIRARQESCSLTICLPIPPNYSAISPTRLPRACMCVCVRRLLVLLASVTRERRRDVTVVVDALSHTFTTRRTPGGIDVGD